MKFLRHINLANFAIKKKVAKCKGRDMSNFLYFVIIPLISVDCKTAVFCSTALERSSNREVWNQCPSVMSSKKKGNVRVPLSA